MERLPNNAMNLNDPAELIDFPVSDAWLEHYHQAHMTPRRPQSNVQAKLNELSGKLEAIESVINGMGELRMQPQHPPPPPPRGTRVREVFDTSKAEKRF